MLSAARFRLTLNLKLFTTPYASTLVIKDPIQNMKKKYTADWVKIDRNIFFKAALIKAL